MQFVRHLAAVAAGAVLLVAGAFTPAGAAEFEIGGTARVQYRVILRSGVMEGTSAITTLTVGTPVELLASEQFSGRQWKVRAGDVTGWVPEKALIPSAPPGKPGAAAAVSPSQVEAEFAARYAALPERLALTAPAEGEDRTAALQATWLAIREGSIEERARACQSLPYSGHSDERFFDALNQWLKLRYEQALADSQKVDVDVTRCLQGLASSGNTKYLETVHSWGRSPRHLIGKYPRKYLVGKAPGFIADSASWNPIINSGAEHTAGRSWATTRVINMIKSGKVALQREGMRRMKRQRTEHAAAFDVLAEQLRMEAAQPNLDPYREGSIAWQCRTLAESRNPRYADTLLKVADETSNPKVKRHCQRALDELDDPPSEVEDPDEDILDERP